MKKKIFILVAFVSITNYSYSQDSSNYPDGYVPVEALSDLNGNWKYGNDILKIDTKKNSIQFNDGMKMFLDHATLPAYKSFYIYGRIGNIDGRAIFRSRVRLSPDRKKIHLDRVDGGASNIFIKQ